MTMMRLLLERQALFVLLAAAVVASACGQPGVDPSQPADPVNVLTVGGGSWHDFDRWFDQEDAETVENAGAVAGYVDEPAHVLAALDTVDVLRMTTNQQLPGSDLREGIFHFVDAGKGLLIEHPGAWYNWQDWPQYNRELVGGGSRSHRQYGAFEVNVVAPDHPIMADVPSSFTIEDELYRFEQDPEGSSIDVLATAEETETGDVYPIVWTVNHLNGRIVVNTLGHDGASHQHPAYVQILENSINWAARRGQGALRSVDPEGRETGTR